MTREYLAPEESPLFWVGSAMADLMRFPPAVRNAIGCALSVAQFGGKHPRAKPWKGLGPGVLEIVEDYRGGTWRAVYTVRLAGAIYVLHAFQKKSPRGITTARGDIAMVERRLRAAERDYEARYGTEKHPTWQ